MENRCGSFRLLVVCAFVFIAAAFAFAGEGPSSDSVDLVFLFDTSESVLPYFDDVIDFLISSTVRDYLRYGDSFHLITFAESCQIEIAEPVTSAADLRTILGRLYLLYPFGKYTDLISALKYLYQYTADLPERNSKVIVIITDGLNNPPPSSSFADFDSAKVLTEIESTSSRIRQNGWKVFLVKVPLPLPGAGGLVADKDSTKPAETKPSTTQYAKPPQGFETSSAKEPSSDEVVKSLSDSFGAEVFEFTDANKEDSARISMALPVVVFPAHLGRKDSIFTIPYEIRNESSGRKDIELLGLYYEGKDILRRNAFLKLEPSSKGTLSASVEMPEGTEEGEKAIEVELVFGNGMRAVPQHGIVSFTLAVNPFSAFFRKTAPVALFLVILATSIALILLLVILFRRAPAISSRSLVRAVNESREDEEKARLRTAADAPRETGPTSGYVVASDASPVNTAVEVPLGAIRTVRMETKAEETARKKASLEEGREARAAEVSGLREEGIPGAEGLAPTQAEGEASLGAIRTIPLELRTEKSSQETRLEERRAEEAAAAAEKAAMDLTAKLGIKRRRSIRVVLTVEEQNPNIGLRNVHELKAGGKYSVGGGRSDFSIFVVPVPRRIAEIYFDGEDCTFFPIRKDFFPGITGPVGACVGKTVAAEAKNGYALRIRLEPWESSTERMNKFLRCIDVPGIFKRD